MSHLVLFAGGGAHGLLLSVKPPRPPSMFFVTQHVKEPPRLYRVHDSEAVALVYRLESFDIPDGEMPVYVIHPAPDEPRDKVIRHAMAVASASGGGV